MSCSRDLRFVGWIEGGEPREKHLGRFSCKFFVCHRGLLFLYFAVILFLCSSAANATTYYWNVASGDWSSAANWKTSVEPTTNVHAYIDNGGTALITQIGEQCSILEVGYTSGYSGIVNMTSGTIDSYGIDVGFSGTGSFSQSGGTNTILGWISSINIGSNSGSTGTYNLSGTALLYCEGSSEFIGLCGTGHFIQSGGTNQTHNISEEYEEYSTTKGGSIYIGYGSYSTGVYTLTGGGVVVSSGGEIAIGSNGRFEWYGGSITTPSMYLLSNGVLAIGFNCSIDSLYNGNLFSCSNFDTSLGTLEITNGVSATHVNKTNISVKSLVVGSDQGDGSYFLDGAGEISAKHEYVGYNKNGTVTQTGGVNLVTDCLHVGYNDGSSGIYYLSGTGMLSAYTEYIGDAGTGVFTQTGGTNLITNILSIGFNSNGIYNLSSSGVVSAELEFIGDYGGHGIFTHNGGTNSTYTLYVGAYEGSSGIYNLCGEGSLVASNEMIGVYGTATFNQSSGTNNATYFISLGCNSNVVGIYNMSGSSLIFAQSEWIGSGGFGMFLQTGGTNSILGSLHIGYISNGSYNLSGDSLITVGSDEYIGYELSSIGILTQNGGTNFIDSNARLYLGFGTGTSGTYNFNSGTLITSSIIKGKGNAIFNFGGGILQVNGNFTTSVPMTLTGINGNANVNSSGYTVTLSGVLSGTGGLTKTGSGTLTLSAAETYSGNTVVTAGTLVFSGGISAAGTPLIDIKGGKAILKTTNISKTDLDVYTGSSAVFEVADGTHTLGDISGNGTTQVNAGASLTVASIIQSSLVIGDGAVFTIGGSSAGASSTAIESVPEPGTWILLFTACMAVIAYRRRKSG